MSSQDTDRLVDLRRELHRRPEPAWREFWTTARIVDELERIGVDEVLVGPEVLDGDQRMGVPDEAELDGWFEQAREAGAREDVLDRLEGGFTGAIGVLERGDGPTVGLRVDIDGLRRKEATDESHAPVAGGFRSIHEGAMHGCGHDAHMTIGLGVLEAVRDGDFAGTLKVFFQPAEEVVGGGKPMAESGRLDDVDYLLALHVGLDHPTGEVVAGVDGFLAVHDFFAEFTGESAHAGARPADGRNAVQAMATAVQNLYGISRHQDGPTRVNAGRVGGGTASNVVPEEAFVEGEVRGETTDLMTYTRDRAMTVLEHAAAMHDCEVDVTPEGEAPSATSDDAIRRVVADVADATAGVESVRDTGHLGASEDATHLMRRVQDHGGNAAYVIVGTDHPGGHHTATFDVDERTLDIGVDVLQETIRRLAAEQP
ncbi:MAG: amidohydrolase [Haloarculaceae archaeon]